MGVASSLRLYVSPQGCHRLTLPLASVLILLFLVAVGINFQARGTSTRVAVRRIPIPVTYYQQAPDPLQKNETKDDTPKTWRPWQTYQYMIETSHHKTGSFQLGCIHKIVAEYTGNNYMDIDYGFFQYFNATLNKTVEVNHPIEFKRYNIDEQLQAHNKKINSTTRFIRGNHGLEICQNGCQYNCPCKDGKAHCLALSDACNLSSPKRKFQVTHIVRHPIDTVISAYLYHSNPAAVEKWLILPVMFEATQRIRHETDPLNAQRIQKLTMPPFPPPNTSYHTYLRSFPPETGILIEVWQSLPELTTMVRQYIAAEKYDDDNPSVNIRFEDMRRRYNETVVKMISRLDLGLQPETINQSLLPLLLECDPGQWRNTTLIQLDHHITAGYGKNEDKTKPLQAVIMKNAYALQHLCSLTALLKYDDPRCVNVALEPLETL